MAERFYGKSDKKFRILFNGFSVNPKYTIFHQSLFYTKKDKKLFSDEHSILNNFGFFQIFDKFYWLK
jgi:hypothetical protein